MSGKYSKYSSRVPIKPRPWTIHPIWRGIGCLLLLLVPPMSYAAGALLAEMNLEQGWLPAPYELYQAVTIPGLNLTVNHLWANLATGMAVMVLGFGVLMFFYTIIYYFLGPKRYSGVDAPPVRRSPRKRRY